eukprot:7488404-Pyramimonas_sp.AAC.2
MYDQTAAAKRQAEMEAENRYLGMLVSERQAVVAATTQSVDAKAATAAAAAARVEGEQIATVRAERDKRSLQEELKTRQAGSG